MSQEMIGALMIGCMLFAIFVGFPISFTLIFLGGDRHYRQYRYLYLWVS